MEVRAGTHGRNWKTGIKAEVMMNAAYWFPAFALFIQLLYTFQVHLPRGGTTHSGVGPLN